MTDDQEAPRPSPDALLEAARQEGRGRLKVFLGAAPGVGKTYEMLLQARARRFEGIDVVAGVVETHGRIETESLLRGVETIPKKRIPYRGHVLSEMDLDAILQRRPKLVLVDELAHTNAPGSRHPKRYMDIEELIAAGIDVYTTLNIQHLESLNDVVAKITRIRVREQVPDSLLDRADEIELVDTTPDDLLKRLREGKIYVADTAARAVRHYFLPGNLTALRELALRRTAQRVDEQMLNYMRAHAIQGPWEASERVLVCIDGGPGAAALVRFGRRLADRLGATWTAIYIETAQTAQLPERERDVIAEAMRSAERLGGQAVTLSASHAADAVVAYARNNNFTHVVLASSRHLRFWENLRGSFASAVIRRAGDLNIHIIPDSETPSLAASLRVPSPPREPKAYLGAALAVLGALAVGEGLRYFGITNVALVFLTAVLVSAVAYGLWPALFACVVATLAYNFFFIPPLYTFTVSDPENVVALLFFALVAIVAGNLTARVRAQALTAQSRARTTESLYLFSRKLAGIAEMDDLMWATAYQMSSMLKVHVVLLLPEGDSIAIRSGYPPEDTLNDADLAAAKWVWAHGSPAGRGADTLPGARRLFLPLKTGRGLVGVVGLDHDRPGPMLSAEQQRLLGALCDQAALAIERIALADDIDRARIAAEAERLRSALLTSLSHDLRTPLASILGSATALQSYGEAMDPAGRSDLTATIVAEAERLNRFIANLLDMTRLESGTVAPKQETLDLADVVGSALRRAAPVLASHQVETELPPHLPSLTGDAVLLEQAIFNLLDNAAKYTPAGSRIRIEARLLGRDLQLRIIDEGPGIPGAALERIFDKFHRLETVDSTRAGTGLGLAICRGFVEAMGGRVNAMNRIDGKGAIFTITLPAHAALPQEAIAS